MYRLIFTISNLLSVKHDNRLRSSCYVGNHKESSLREKKKHFNAFKRDFEKRKSSIALTQRKEIKNYCRDETSSFTVSRPARITSTILLNVDLLV